MTTTSSGSSSSPSPKQDNSKQKLIAVSAVIIFLLLATVIGLAVRLNNVGNTKAALSTQLDESEQLKAELEKQYYEALSELEEMRGSNEELNALIESQKEELKTQKDEIASLIAKKRDYDRVRRKMNELNQQVEQYVAEINQLREENELLTTKNTELNDQNQTLSTNLETERVNNQELTTAKAALVSEKEELTKTNENLSRKVNIASVIKVESIEVTGIKIKKSGKAVKKKYAKNIDQLKVCFNTTANNVVDPGLEQFVIRIVNPLGETLAVEELGSGVFTNSQNGDQIRYTSIKEEEYNQDANTLCTSWAPNQPFQKGEYTIEVFNKGFLAGTNTFKLK